MPEIVNEVEQDLVNAYKNILGEFGAHSIFAELYFKIFFNAEPVGINELAEETGYSISTVSNTMKALEKMLDIEKLKKPGSKRVYFKCKYNMMEVSERTIKSKVDFMEVIIQTLATAEEKLKISVDPAAKDTLEKVHNLKDDFERIETMTKDLLNMHQQMYNDKKSG